MMIPYLITHGSGFDGVIFPLEDGTALYMASACQSLVEDTF
jgi:hypothetical protein